MAATSVATSVGVATKSGILANVGSTFIGPFLGPVAGIATFFIVKKILDSVLLSPEEKEEYFYKEFTREAFPDFFESNRDTFEFSKKLPPNYFKESVIIPTFGVGKQPLGELKGDKLLLSSDGLGQAEQIFGD